MLKIPKLAGLITRICQQHFRTNQKLQGRKYHATFQLHVCMPILCLGKTNVQASWIEVTVCAGTQRDSPVVPLKCKVALQNPCPQLLDLDSFSSRAMTSQLLVTGLLRRSQQRELQALCLEGQSHFQPPLQHSTTSEPDECSSGNMSGQNPDPHYFDSTV